VQALLIVVRLVRIKRGIRRISKSARSNADLVFPNVGRLFCLLTTKNNFWTTRPHSETTYEKLFRNGAAKYHLENKYKMDKTLLRHRTRRHPLYRDGAFHIARVYSDDLKKQQHLLNQWLKFCIWSIGQDADQLETLSSVIREHVIRYGLALKNEFLNGRFASSKTVSGYISAMNTIMNKVRGDAWENVRPAQDCGVELISYIPNRKPKLDKEGLPDIDELVGYLLELQCALGVDIREALSLNLKRALDEGRRAGVVTITNWRSGAHRKVPCRPRAVQALGQAVVAQRLQKRLPKPMDYNEFVAAHRKLAARQGYSTNTARGVYVRERYQEITGLPAPVVSGLSQAAHLQEIADYSNRALSAAQNIDKTARHIIAKELGVLGVEALTAYLDTPL
jgi:hypothetical protein